MKHKDDLDTFHLLQKEVCKLITNQELVNKNYRGIYHFDIINIAFIFGDKFLIFLPPLYGSSPLKIA